MRNRFLANRASQIIGLATIACGDGDDASFAVDVLKAHLDGVKAGTRVLRDIEYPFVEEELVVCSKYDYKRDGDGPVYTETEA